MQSAPDGVQSPDRHLQCPEDIQQHTISCWLKAIAGQTLSLTDCLFCRAMRVMRISLLAGQLQMLHLRSGALLSNLATLRLLQLIASVLALLFTTASIVRRPASHSLCMPEQGCHQWIHMNAYPCQRLISWSPDVCKATTCASVKATPPCVLFILTVQVNEWQPSRHVQETQFCDILQVHLVERVPWHTALYFTVTTLTTVGFGDVVVTSLVGRIAVVAMICVGIVVIPVQTSQLYSQLSSRPVILG